MRCPWKRARPIEPRRAVGGKAMEMQTAKEIPAAVFGARPGEVEEMMPEKTGGEELAEGTNFEVP